MKPVDALKAATSASATVLGLEEVPQPETTGIIESQSFVLNPTYELLCKLSAKPAKVWSPAPASLCRLVGSGSSLASQRKILPENKTLLVQGFMVGPS